MNVWISRARATAGWIFIASGTVAVAGEVAVSVPPVWWPAEIALADVVAAGET